MKEYFKKLFKYNTWANLQMAECLANQVTNEKSTIGLLAHILTAEKLWLGRILKSEELVTDVWPSLSIGSCRNLAEENSARFIKLLDELTEERLVKPVEYKTTTGKSHSQNLSDILTQLITHGAHHRALINADIKQSGGDPVSIDYIVFVRNL